MEVTKNRDELKKISLDFLTLPMQAVRCCLRGFTSPNRIQSSMLEQMVILVENAMGERNILKVQKDGAFQNSEVVSLIDASILPNMHLSARFLQLISRGSGTKVDKNK